MRSETIELSIDTSTRYAGVGLSLDGKLILEINWHSQRNHTVELIPAIQTLLGQSDSKVTDIEAIFVSKGPGGFSSLRVGMGAAKGLAEALDIPLLGIRTLEIEAFSYSKTGKLLCPILSVGRGEFAWALFQEVEGVWTCLKDEEIGSPQSFFPQLPLNVLICGEPVFEAIDILGGFVVDQTNLLPVLPPTRRTSTLAHLGFIQYSHGIRSDRSTLQPLYLRSPSIN
jgi:tRNA threonylcarbamoyladenosine biosynthesis protein TsaB